MFERIVIGIAGEQDAAETRALAERLADPGAEFIPTTIDGGSGLSIGSGLRDAALEADADLIVVGSSRRGLIGRILAGHDVKDVLHETPCAVAIAPVGYRAPSRKLHKIVVGHDGSAAADAALMEAARLRDRCGSEITIVEVIEPYSGSVAAFAGSTLTEDRHAARANLDRLRRRYHVDGAILSGSAGRELASAGRGADLIVIGSDPRSRLERLLVGSTAHALLRQPSTPLLVVPCALAGDLRAAALSADNQSG